MCCVLLYFTLLVFYVQIGCLLFYIILLCVALWKACAFKKCAISKVDWIGFVLMQFVIPQIKKMNAICFI